MTAEANDHADEQSTALSEGDGEPTRMTYGEGRTTWYLVALWVTVATGLIIYGANLLVPSLSSWGAP